MYGISFIEIRRIEREISMMIYKSLISNYKTKGNWSFASRVNSWKACSRVMIYIERVFKTPREYRISEECLV